VNRKGSMQLSIEAIIILVIAIVLLGLGIAFIKGFFGKGTDALLGSFDAVSERCDVSSDNPIIPKAFSVKQGEANQIKICVYNNQQQRIPNGVFKIANCVNPAGNPLGATPPASALPSGELKFTSLGQDIERGETKGYKTNVQAGSSASPGVYICNIEVSCGAATGVTCPTTAPTPKVTTQVSITVN
jgi:hypothetical protein